MASKLAMEAACEEIRDSMNCSIKEQDVAPGLKRDDWTSLYCTYLFIKMPPCRRCAYYGRPLTFYFLFLLLFIGKKKRLDPFLETECGFCALTTSSPVRFVESVL